MSICFTEQSAITAILDYWFADIGDGFDIKSQQKIWYLGDETVDNDIQQRFGDWVERALARELDNWCVTPEGTLALVLLLDQFTRNIYRNSAKAFSGDELARQIVNDALAMSVEQKLTSIQHTFLYMPFMHSESLDDQERCIALFETLLQAVPAEGKRCIEGNLDFAIQHKNIIEAYGRFPYRNAVLGRENTEHELNYLNNGGSSFGQ